MSESWTRARLIPVSGISSTKEAETRAASAVLAVISVVRDLSTALFTPLGASRAAKATVETFIEPEFKLENQRLRPDGIVRIEYGKSTWTAIVEFKTGTDLLNAEQINAYWAVARDNGFDAVITISNEIAASPGLHPTAGLKVRSNSKVQIHHISWTALLSTAVTIKSHKGVNDPEQAWLLGELIRYLEHSASGAMAFDDMGANWVSVRAGARDGSLRKGDDAVADIAQRWDQLLRYAALQLGARIGSDVLQVLPRNQSDQKTRLAHLSNQLVSAGTMDGALRVPNTVSDIAVRADLKARLLSASISVAAPDDRGGKARVNWLLKQLGPSPADLTIEAFPKNARTPYLATVTQLEANRDLLLGPDRRDPARFVLLWTVEMGSARKAGTKSVAFVDSVVTLIENFYELVVQRISVWTPAAPKVSTPRAVPASVDDDHGLDDETDTSDFAPSAELDQSATTRTLERPWLPPFATESEQTHAEV